MSTATFAWRCSEDPIDQFHRVKQGTLKIRYGARGRARTGTAQKRQDFKSCVSTNFTTRADSKGA